jgi:hypothetical protein
MQTNWPSKIFCFQILALFGLQQGWAYCQIYFIAQQDAFPRYAMSHDVP